MQDEGHEALLARFARLVAEATTTVAIMEVLARAGVDDVHASAAAVFEIQASRAVLVARHGLARPAAGFSVEAETIGEELGELLTAAAGRKGAHARTLPLVSTGGLFGALVLVFASEKRSREARMDLAATLVDLAAIALQRAAQLMELQQSYSELHASREVLARSAKLRALGEMAAGVSHDLKNILNPLSLHLQILQRAVPATNEVAVGSIREMQGVVHRGVETLNRLREFSRQAPETKLVRVDLNHVAHEALEICRPRLHTRHDLHVTLKESLGAPPAVLVREGELVAVAVNLIANGMDAIGEGSQSGSILVETGATDDGRGFLRVVDDGPGMPPEVEQRVFEPFFTTKGAEGTGLGLAMAYAFVQRFRGTIELETHPGEGTRITIAFAPARDL